VPETTLLRASPGSRMATPLCRIAQEMAAHQGWRRYGIAFLLGALLAAALPPVDLTPVVFVVFPLYLWLDDGSETAWASARLGYVFALGHFAAGLYWIAAALFVDIERYWWALPFAVLGIPAVLATPVALSLYVASLATSRLKLWGLARICAFAVMWSVAEWLRGHLFTGLPWNLLGYVWAGGFPGGLAMLQSVAWIGIYGLGFVTVLAASLLALLGAPALIPIGRWRFALPAIAAAVLILAPATVGAIQLRQAPSSETGIWLRLVQPSIPQTAKWDPAEAEANFHRLTELSSAPSEHKLSAVIWPEAASTFFLERDTAHRTAVAAVAPDGGYVITGALRGSPLSGPLKEVWNSIDIIDPAAEIIAQYDKAHLVPFGEYVPFRDVLPFHKLTAGSIDLSAGPGPQTIGLTQLPPFAPLICYEAIFPGAIVDARQRPSWILNVSNDAWYGRTSGPYQHFAMARTRAVEEGLPLVRAANNGISGVIDAEGRVLASTKLDAVTYADIKLPAVGPATLYSRLGDWVFLAMLAAGALFSVTLGLARPTR
jgi:apolipoprotein N-acyltransferase